MNYILLIIGFVLLIKGADIFVDGAAAIAKKFGIPSIIVGLTIVSLGTSAPELSVSLVSSLQGTNEITLGNVLGSNIFNTLMVIGITSIIMPIMIKKSEVFKDYIISLIITSLLLVVTFAPTLFNSDPIISRIGGIFFLGCCIFYTIYLINVAKNSDTPEEDDLDVSDINLLKCIIRCILGVIGIIIGGNLVVNSAKEIALTFGMSEKLIGLTIIAMGTSLPELVTSIVAALKGQNDIAVGNVLGSNIFNILLILGTSATILPIPVSPSLFIDMLFLIGITAILGLFMFLGKNKENKISRIEGILLVLLYVGYTTFIIMRN